MSRDTTVSDEFASVSLSFDPSEEETKPRKIKLSRRRARLGSIPCRFVQTDEELQLLGQAMEQKQTHSLKEGDKFQRRRSSISTEFVRSDSACVDQCDSLAGKSEASEKQDCFQRRLLYSLQSDSDVNSVGFGSIEFGSVDISSDNVFDVDKNYKHESIYRELLCCVLHPPPGAPEISTGLRPRDLHHLREVFRVSRPIHEQYVQDELSEKPRPLQVNLGILEAKDVTIHSSKKDEYEAYCLVNLVNPAKGRRTPSPRDSPKMLSRMANVNRSGSLPDEDMQRTSSIRHSGHPRWNEEFTLDLDEYTSSELHIFMFSLPSNGETKLPEKSSGRKSLLSIIRPGYMDHEKLKDFGCLGKITVPVKEISVMGKEEWFDIVTLDSQLAKPKTAGKCHLRLGISYKQGSNATRFSNEDYYQAFLQFLAYTHRHLDDLGVHPHSKHGLITDKDYLVLKMFAEAHRISKLSQAVVNVICLLELITDKRKDDILEVTLTSALRDLQSTWSAMHAGQKGRVDRMPLTDTEICHYRRAAGNYIHQRNTVMEELPPLVPPTNETMNVLKAKLGVMMELLRIDLWEPGCAAQTEISQKILRKLQDDVTKFVDKKVMFILEPSDNIMDKVITQISRLVEVINELAAHCLMDTAISRFYKCFNVDFYRVAGNIIQKRVSAISQQVMQAMNKYMRCYNSYSVNMMMASKLTLGLYFTLRKLHSALWENVSRRDAFKMALFSYQEWFEEAMIAWLQTFKTECVNRMEKALEIDKDVVVVTDLVKFSHSSVDVLSCFASVIEEWRKIEFNDPDCTLIGVTKITDILCDGALLYADKVHVILKNNGYYDHASNEQFDVNDRLCITINNIEHVRSYLEDLSTLLSWDTMAMMISARHQSDDIGHSAVDTLQRLVKTTNDEILSKSRLLMRQIAEKMRGDMKRYMYIFTNQEPERASSIDQFLGYISANLHTLHDELMPAIYPHMAGELWYMILHLFNNQLAVGQRPEYYEHMKQHLRTMESAVLRGRMDEKFHTAQYKMLQQRLEENSRSTEDLLLQYFTDISANTATTPEYYGHITLKVAYVEETHNKVTIFVEVLKANNLPGLDSTGLSDPYVEVSLQPSAVCVFAGRKRTAFVKQTLNPVFNASFQFPNIPREFLKRKGICVMFSIFDHDMIGQDDFAGEVVINLLSIPAISMNKSMDTIPVVSMMLRRPDRPINGPFSVLEERDWDKSAKEFVVTRSRFIDNLRKRTDQPSKVTTNAGFFSIVKDLIS